MDTDFDDLDDLYQQVILEHSRKPRNFHAIDDADASAEGYNPLCGDRVTIFARRNDAGDIEDIAFTGKGCAICTASASMMTQSLKGVSAERLTELFEHFHHMLTEATDSADEEVLGKLAVFHGVRKYPIRVKCATLPWHTLKSALENEGETVTTE